MVCKGAREYTVWLRLLLSTTGILPIHTQTDDAARYRTCMSQAKPRQGKVRSELLVKERISRELLPRFRPCSRRLIVPQLAVGILFNLHLERHNKEQVTAQQRRWVPSAMVNDARYVPTVSLPGSPASEFPHLEENYFLSNGQSRCALRHKVYGHRSIRGQDLTFHGAWVCPTMRHLGSPRDGEHLAKEASLPHLPEDWTLKTIS